MSTNVTVYLTLCILWKINYRENNARRKLDCSGDCQYYYKYYINIHSLGGEILDCYPEETLKTKVEVDNAFQGVKVYHVMLPRGNIEDQGRGRQCIPRGESLPCHVTPRKHWRPRSRSTMHSKGWKSTMSCYPEETLKTKVEVDNAFQGVKVYHVIP